MRNGSEKPRIEADGWIHRQPVDPKEKQAKTVVNVCGFGLGILLCIFGVPELGLIVIGLTVLANVFDPLMDRSITMCPKCHTRRPYSRYQEVCAGCGYRPDPKKESDRGARTVYRLGADDAGSGSGSASHSHRRRG